MSMVKSFTVGGVAYNAVMATAVKQDELLSMLTAPIMERSVHAARAGIDIDEKVLAPLFMAMPHDLKSKVAAILMGRVVINGTDRVVTLEDFGGKMVHYNTLLAQLLQWNLADFFDWLPSVLADARAADGKQAAP